MKTCLITGATSGIGRAAAGDLGRRGWRLLLTGRNEPAGRRLLAEMRRAFPNASAEFFPADISELGAVRALAAWVSNRTDRLDGLINNAGARFDHYGQTTAGVERTFATNHLGHFLLTFLLADLVAAGVSGRIIMLGSVAHQRARPALGWNLGAAHYDGKVAYANAKLACILFARELARRLADPNVIACAVDPGIVATAFARNNGWLAWCKHRLYHRFKGNLISAAAGAAGVVHVATVEAARLKRGGYYCGDRLADGASATEDAALARELWEASERLSGIHGTGGEVEQAGVARPRRPAQV
ncbi:MAG TPA: SDR family NAD(P)-dependent oxidoreductase [Verrucomicrobiae bacterium]|nr:SDR family NAD(P)-dependent oxidoreductase [Verrucomicrobiae bacterium]